MASTMNGARVNGGNGNSEMAGQMRLKLQALLGEKERQLQQAEALGQRILAQQVELEERINQIAELDEAGNSASQPEEDKETEMRAHLDELAQTMHGWATENETLWAGAVTRDVPAEGQGVGQYDSETQRAAHAPSAAQSSRRAKNAAHRANDAEFAFEIGSGLITEIRRLQSLLTERDKTLQDMKEEKDDLERAMDNLRATLRTQEANADKYREENWNLEVSLQDLRTQVSDLQSSNQRAEAEQKRTQKQLTTLRETAEGHKTEAERLTNVLADKKNHYETETAQMRRQVATLQKEKGEIQIQVESLKSEVAKKSRAVVGRFGTPTTPNDQVFRTPAKGGEFGDEEDNDLLNTAASNRRRMDSSLVYGDTFDLEVDQFSPENSPIKGATARSPLIPNRNASEVESLQQQLEAAQREVEKYKKSLAKEQQLRATYGRQLEEQGVAVPIVVEDKDDDYLDEPGDLPRVTPLRAGRRNVNPMKAHRTNLLVALAKANAKAGRQSQDDPFRSIGGGAGAQELPEADFSITHDDWVDVDEEGAEQPRRSIESIGASTEEGHGGGGRFALENLGRHRSQSAVSVTSSMDGMDPAFANVLKNRDSMMSSDLGHGTETEESPVKKSTKARMMPIGVLDSRPGSILNAPGTLASELGGLDGADGHEMDEDRLRAELGIDEEIESLHGQEHEEDEEEVEQPSTPVKTVAPIVAPIPAPVPVKREEMGIQCDLLPTPQPVVVPAPVPVPEPKQEPVVQRSEMSIQTDEEPEPPAPKMAEEGIQTTVETESIAVSTDSAPEKVYAETSTGTDEEVRTPPAAGRRVPLEIFAAGAAGVAAGAVAAEVADHHHAAAATATTSAAANASTSSDTGHARKRSSVPPTSFKPRPYSRADTETTEGDTEWEDAKENVTETTPYHSVDNLNESDDGTDTDAESIRVSRMLVTAPRLGGRSGSVGSDEEIPTASGMETEVPIRDRTFSNRTFIAEDVTKRDTVRPTPAPAPKPELKDESTQTDEWIPPIPTNTPLFTVGPQAQQFQFIPPGATTTPGVSSIALPTGVTALKIAPIAAAAAVAVNQTQRSRVSTSASGISTAASAVTGNEARSRVSSAGTLSVPSSPKSVDRTRPPMMMLPPPPRLPPPPASPPATLAAPRPGPPNMGPPPRPTSPPPAELIQRATTPTLGRNSMLNVPGRTISTVSTASRPISASTMPGSQGRQVRAAIGGAGAGEDLQDPFTDAAGRPQPNSMASLTSSRRSFSSRRNSVSSSISSAEHAKHAQQSRSSAIAPTTTTSQDMMMMPRSVNGDGSTDPSIIHAITQTMIGEYLYKYTRRPIGKKHAERRHRRYFWIHPYTKTIYWSEFDPGSSGITESSAKSAYIESVKAVMDPNPMPPGLHQYSVIVTTANREMKFTAPTKERHDIWYNALTYLLARPTPGTSVPPSRPPLSPISANQQQRQATLPVEESRNFEYSPRSQRSGLTVDQYSTPKPQRSLSRMSNPYGSIGKRSGTAAAEFMRWTEPPSSPSKIADPTPDSEFHIHDDNNNDAYDGLENVRACCDGKHDVGSLAARQHHHHHHHHHQQQQQQYGTVRSASGVAPPDRPGSPSGWSHRSSRSKSGSHEGGMFSWSRRSRQSSAVRP